VPFRITRSTIRRLGLCGLHRPEKGLPERPEARVIHGGAGPNDRDPVRPLILSSFLLR
jgi:hypothetical protein